MKKNKEVLFAQKTISKPLYNVNSGDTKKSSNNAGNGALVSVLGVIMSLLLFACILGAIFNSANGQPALRSFGGLLEYLQKSQVIPIDWIMGWTNVGILGDWGLFNFLRDFFATIIKGLQYLALLGTGIINSLSGIVFTISYFLGF